MSFMLYSILSALRGGSFMSTQNHVFAATCPTQSKGKMLHIEFLRIIAIYLVLFNHTGVKGFFHFSVAADSHFYWMYLFYSILDKIAVPLFFMISGALLLQKDENLSQLYYKRVLKFIVILLAISAVYQLYDYYVNNDNIELKTILLEFVNGSTSTALWYLYSYIGVLIMLPFLRKLARSLSSNEYLYLIALRIIFFGVFPMIFFLIFREPQNFGNYLPLVTADNIFFLLIGYYAEHLLPDRLLTKKNLLFGLLFSVISIMICCLMTHYKIIVSGDCSESTSQIFHKSLIVIPCITIYLCCKYYFAHRSIPAFIQRIILFFGRTTFGVYLLERILRQSTTAIFDISKPYIHTFPACILWIFCACLIGSVITFLLQKIPIVKNFL